jgi:hypothetical protein
MRVEIRDGGDGVECWNHQAIHDYADGVNAREGDLAQRNPDLVVVPGQISCFGCETQEYGYGIKCTAQIVKTTYCVPGEVKPRPAASAGWHREIPGLLTIKPDTGNPSAGPAGSTSVGRSEPQAAAEPGRVASGAGRGPARGGLRGLFGRNG